ncbi:MAG: S-adenosylmethionine:tRNA ribosyltransferase-isomerase [Actinomycetota bacterium]|nr:S-adenosylmethionine:tRNA ribosyltransferase-isomerase [Actinomycetota bacterium]
MSTSLADAPLTSFTLPRRLAATEPPEARGLRRDRVRMLVARPNGLEHAHFNDLTHILRPGDLVVVNTSATRPAAVDGTRAGGGQIVIHFSTPLDDGAWIVELRAHDGSGPVMDATGGETIDLPTDARIQIMAAHPDPLMATGSRLWRSRVGVDGSIEDWLAKHGRPISYGYLRGRWALSDYQTVFARERGSAEMPSAARPFTRRLVTEMITHGINFAPVVLHCGVSSLEDGEPPQAERFRVPPATAWLVNATRRAGGRVVAVGTTVTRALETVADIDGVVAPGQGWTDLVLGPKRPARAVDGLLTGWHPPRASHLLLLEAAAGADLVQDAYDAAVTAGYLWHEFGDSCLLLPRRLHADPRCHPVPQPLPAFS